MVVALETHLRGCEACAGDVASLRRTWVALEALPQVDPPADFARRVTARVAEEGWARRSARPDFRTLWQGWARSLTPVHGLGAAAVAALVAAGIALPMSKMEGGIPWHVFNLNRTPPVVTATDHPPVQVDPTLAPRVTARATRWENGRWVGVLQVTPARDLPHSAVRATTLTPVGSDRMVGSGVVDLARGDMRAARAYALPIPLAESSLGAHAVMVGVASSALSEEYRKVVAFPLARRSTSGTVSLDVEGEDIYVVLARLAAATRRPIVADAGLTGKVSRRLTAATPEQALNAVLAPLGYGWQVAGDSYVVTRH